MSHHWTAAGTPDAKVGYKESDAEGPARRGDAQNQWAFYTI